MPNPILSISIKGYEPKTYGSNDVERKKELRDLILSKISNLAEIQKNCRGKRLSFVVCFNLLSDTDVKGRKTKDLDNMLKIFCDVFPDFVDRDKKVTGLGLIEEDRDDMIFEIRCKKRLVKLASDEGIDFSIYEYYTEDDKPDPIIIKKEELRSASKKLEQHIRRLLKDAEILYNNDRYVGAIPLIVIAFEEITKLDTLFKHKNQNIGITRSEWLELTNPRTHTKKLTKIYDDAKKGYDKMNKDERMKLQSLLTNLAFPSFSTKKENISNDFITDDRATENLRIMNDIKKYALYFDWRENRALNLDNMIPNNIGHLTNFLFHLTKLQFELVMLNHKYSPFFYTVPKEVNIMMRDPLWKDLDDVYNYIISPDYEVSLKIAYTVLYEMKSLAEFKRKSRGK